MECTADCFQDDCHSGCVRPVSAPKSLVWLYFNVSGEPDGTLEERELTPCPCGCGKLSAMPPASVMKAQSRK